MEIFDLGILHSLHPPRQFTLFKLLPFYLIKASMVALFDVPTESFSLANKFSPFSPPPGQTSDCRLLNMGAALKFSERIKSKSQSNSLVAFLVKNLKLWVKKQAKKKKWSVLLSIILLIHFLVVKALLL